MSFKRKIIIYESEDKKVVFKPWGVGKFLSVLLGGLFFGIPGLFIGLAIGILLDTEYLERQRIAEPADYRLSFLQLGAAVINADGKIQQSEVSYVYTYLKDKFGETYAESRFPIFREFLKQKVNVELLSEQLKEHVTYEVRLQILYFLFGLASGSRDHISKTELISYISGLLDITTQDYLSIKALHDFQQRETSSTYRSPQNGSSELYAILEVSPDASNTEIRKSYFRLAKKYHPDRVSHMGDDYIDSAKEKFQKLQAAYGEIKKERGF